MLTMVAAGFTLQPKPIYIRPVVTRSGNCTASKRLRYSDMGGGSSGSEDTWVPCHERKRLRASHIIREAMGKDGVLNIEKAAGKVASRITSSEADPLVSVSFTGSEQGDWRRGSALGDSLVDDEAFEADSGWGSTEKRPLEQDGQDETSVHGGDLGEHCKVIINRCSSCSHPDIVYVQRARASSEGSDGPEVRVGCRRGK